MHRVSTSAVGIHPKSHWGGFKGNKYQQGHHLHLAHEQIAAQCRHLPSKCSAYLTLCEGRAAEAPGSLQNQQQPKQQQYIDAVCTWPLAADF